MYNINAPIFDSHSWRQADGYAIARNFLEIDANIFYPRVNHAGGLSGIAGSEFPLMNYVVFLSYKIFGVHWWQGRLLNLILSSIGIWYFFKLVYRFIDKKAALPTALILLTSLWLLHSRKFMPDVFSSSLMIIAVYHGWIYLKDNQQGKNLLWFGLFCSLALLSKLPSLVLLGLFLPVLLNKQININAKVLFITSGVVALLPAIYWYFIWTPYLTHTYGFDYFFMGVDLSVSFHEISSNLNGLLQRFYVDALNYVGFIAMCFGLYMIFKKSNNQLILGLIGALALLCIIILKSGHNFIHHSYYIMPFVPVMALIAGYGVGQITNKAVFAGLLALIMLEGIGNTQHDLHIKHDQMYKLEFESIVDKHSSKSDKIAVNNSSNPTALYFAHRQGWSFNPEDVGLEEKYKLFYLRGCKLILWDKNIMPAPSKIFGFTKSWENKDVSIYLRELAIQK